MQLNRVLPPGPREYWNELAAEHKNAPEHTKWMYDTDPFAARKEVDERQAKAAKKREEVDEMAEEAGNEPQFVIEDEDEDQERDSRLEDSQPSAKKQLPSLGERLFGAVIDLMFCCGFTLPTKIQVDHHKINYLIWYVSTSLTTTSRSFGCKGERHWLYIGHACHICVR